MVWGWSHCVQQIETTAIAIEKKLTLLAFEDMFSLNSVDNSRSHVFYQNNELAGYCAVLHALQLKGLDGNYGNQRKILLIGFGSVTRGAVYALKGRGYKNITICTRRDIGSISNIINGCKYITISNYHNNKKLISLIGKSDIIINGILQDPNNPSMFINEKEPLKLKRKSLIIDVSCDENMGFSFAKPTTFENPIFKEKTIDYYGVDHTPSYLWESATRTISDAVINYLPNVILDEYSGSKGETLKKATNIRNGIIVNNDIILFQNRAVEYPHNIIK